MILVFVIGRKKNNRGLHSTYYALSAVDQNAQGHESATISFIHPVPGFLVSQQCKQCKLTVNAVAQGYQFPFLNG